MLRVLTASNSERPISSNRLLNRNI
jgi:hypothetical protein